MRAAQLYKFFESVIPPLEAEEIDCDGIHTMPYPDKEIEKVLISLDPYEIAVSAAIHGGYDLLLTHHPLFWGEPLPNTPPEYWYNKLIGAGIASFSFHMRLDRADGGVNDILASLLELKDVKTFDDEQIMGLGRIGYLETPVDTATLAERVKLLLGVSRVRYLDTTDGRMISRVAVVGGSVTDMIAPAAAAGADVLVGGEFKHHAFGYAAAENCGKGIALIEAGHYHTEYPVCSRLAELAREALPGAVIDIISCDNVKVI